MNIFEGAALGSYQHRLAICDELARLFIDRSADGVDPHENEYEIDPFRGLVAELLPEGFSEDNPHLDTAGVPEVPHALMAARVQALPETLAGLVHKGYISMQDRDETLVRLGFDDIAA